MGFTSSSIDGSSESRTMAYKYFNRECLTSLSEKKVEKNKCSREACANSGCGKCNKYMPEEIAQIGKYAAENGLAKRLVLQRIVLFLCRNSEQAVEILLGTFPTTISLCITATAYGFLLLNYHFRAYIRILPQYSVSMYICRHDVLDHSFLQTVQPPL